MLREPPAEPGMEIHWDNGEALVIVRGELDGVTAAELADPLGEVDKVLRVLNGEPRRLVVNLADVGFVNRTVVRALDGACHRLAPQCPLVVRSPSRAARKALTPASLLDGSNVARHPVLRPVAHWPPRPEGDRRRVGRRRRARYRRLGRSDRLDSCSDGEISRRWSAGRRSQT